MKKPDTILGLLRVPLDALAVMAALMLAFRFREGNIDLIPNVQLLDPAITLPTFDYYVWHFVFPSIAVFLMIIATLKLYVLKMNLNIFREIARVMQATLLWLVCIIAWYFLVERELFYSRILLLHSVIFIVVFCSAGRVAVRLLQHAMLRHGIGALLIVSVGSSKMTKATVRVLENDLHYGYLGHISGLDALVTISKEGAPDLVIQTDPNPASEDTVALIDYCRSHHIGYSFLPPVFADVPHLLRVERLGAVPMLRFQPTPLDGWGKVFKRIFDIVGSIVLILIFSPVLLLVGLLIALESGFPVLYFSNRVGEHGADTFPMIKFRSMIKNADAKKKDLLDKNERNDGPLFKMKDDPRITKLGAFLRRFDIDELPQLFNVLIGHMSLVGPRPHLPEEVAKYKPYERRVFAVKPGITGLAQISGRSDLTFEEEVHLDLEYVEEWFLARDLRILLQTVWVVLKKGG